MTGTRIPHIVGNKSTDYQLDNGFQVTVEFSSIYGNHVTRFDFPDGSYWHCSNGLKGLPEFARPWVRGGTGHDSNLVNPEFEEVYPE